MSAAVLALVAGGASAPVILDQFIREVESSQQYELRAYLDGARVWTICDGKTEGVTAETVMTREECDAWRETEIGRRLAVARKVIKVEMSEAALAGFGSFCWNVGDAGCGGSTAARKINAGDQVGGCQAMGMWRFITRSMTVSEAMRWAYGGASNGDDIRRRVARARGSRVDVKVDCSDEQAWCRGVWDRRQQEIQLCLL